MKRTYIKPIANSKNIIMESLLHKISRAPFSTNTVDASTTTVGFTDQHDLGVNNNAYGTVNFANDRASIDWDF